MLENEYLMQHYVRDRLGEARAIAAAAAIARHASTAIALAGDDITYTTGRALDLRKVVALYRANHWSSADKPRELRRALRKADAVIAAWHGDDLVGLGYAISDGALVVYYPHLLVLPEYQGRGVGRAIVDRLRARYAGYHQHVLIADGRAVDFYRKCGFERAGRTEPMWIYAGADH